MSNDAASARHLLHQGRSYSASVAKQVTIEALFEQIEEAVTALEAGELPLEDALARFETGLKALRSARGLLDQYATRLEELRGDESVPTAES
jgi:exodeoxyribonuclease VII small subunit